MDKVTHFEIPAEDVSRANAFYLAVFGWKINKVPDMDYWMANTVETDENHMPKEAGAINGGIYKKDSQSADHAMIVINVDSIEDSIKKIQESGGKIDLSVQKVGDFGLYARFKDTEGNLIGIWQTVKK